MNETVRTTVKFLTFMQKYSGIREIEMELPRNLSRALDHIINRYNIPWKGNLEKNGAILVNGRHYQTVLKTGEQLSENDTIVFVPIIGGG